MRSAAARLPQGGGQALGLGGGIGRLFRGAFRGNGFFHHRFAGFRFFADGVVCLADDGFRGFLLAIFRFIFRPGFRFGFRFGLRLGLRFLVVVDWIEVGQDEFRAAFEFLYAVQDLLGGVLGSRFGGSLEFVLR